MKNKSVLHYDALGSLADVYDDLDQPDETLKVHERIIEKHRKKLNVLIERFGTEEHDDVISRMKTIARNCKKIHRIEEVLEWQKRIVDILKFWKGEDDIDTIIAISDAEEARKYLGELNELNGGNKDKNIE